MKKFTVVETAIIGFFIGIVVAAYLTFLANTGGFIGNILAWISWQPLTNAFRLPPSELLLVSFAFFVLVYVAYGIIVGLILQNGRKSNAIVVLAAVILIVLAAGFEQTVVAGVIGPANAADASIIPFEQTADVGMAAAKAAPAAQQYFGMEAEGDLNGDGKSDVAFIIPRYNPGQKTLYYLAAATATSTGHVGTNLLFLGDKVRPRDIGIGSGTIVVDYMSGAATSTRRFYAHIAGGILKQVSGTSTSL